MISRPTIILATAASVLGAGVLAFMIWAQSLHLYRLEPAPNMPPGWSCDYATGALVCYKEPPPPTAAHDPNSNWGSAARSGRTLREPGPLRRAPTLADRVG
jgi:hypothetical protein